MPANIADLTLEHLRLVREELSLMRKEMADFRAQMTAEFSDLKKRFRTQEHHIVGLRRDEAIASEEITDLRHQIDGLVARLETLEARAPH